MGCPEVRVRGVRVRITGVVGDLGSWSGFCILPTTHTHTHTHTRTKGAYGSYTGLFTSNRCPNSKWFGDPSTR